MLYDLREHPNFENIKRCFEEKFTVHSNGCWLWHAATDGHKYGVFNCRDKILKAHRAAWRIYKGPLPEGLILRHTCDTPPCCNPEHLIPGTHRQNVQDMMDRHRQTSGEKNHHCRLIESQVRAIHADPRPHAEIAADFKVNFVTVSNIKTGYSWTHLGLQPQPRTVRTKGEKHGMSKLTEEIVAYIRRSTLSGKALSIELGLSHSTVCRARKGDTWNS